MFYGGGLAVFLDDHCPTIRATIDIPHGTLLTEVPKLINDVIVPMGIDPIKMGDDPVKSLARVEKALFDKAAEEPSGG